MRAIALLMLCMPSLSFGGWTYESTVNDKLMQGFAVYRDGQLVYSVEPEYVFDGIDNFALFPSAMFISDDGYVAGNAFYMVLGDDGFWTSAKMDALIFAAGPRTYFSGIDFGQPAWLNDQEWMCVGSSTSYLFNARSGRRRDVACTNLDPSSVPEPNALALIAALGLVTLRRRGRKAA